MEILRANDVTYEYDAPEEGKPAIQAVQSVSLNVSQGEFLCILGHNGSGKSTFIKLLNGLFLPKTGSVTVGEWDTKDEAHIWDIRQKVGMIFQNPDNQIVATVVEEDVAFGLENMGVEPAEIRRRVDKALKTVNMTEYAKQSPSRLSGGQKQRVAIAGVLAMQPDVLLMDEPTAMLDPSGRKEVMDTVEKLHDEKGMTVVLVTHFMEEALRADRVCVMEKGRIVLEGTPQEVFCQTEAVKKLGLDVPPMLELSQSLKNSGIPMKGNPMTIEEMAQELCRLKSEI